MLLRHYPSLVYNFTRAYSWPLSYFLPLLRLFLFPGCYPNLHKQPHRADPILSHDFIFLQVLLASFLQFCIFTYSRPFLTFSPAQFLASILFLLSPNEFLSIHRLSVEGHYAEFVNAESPISNWTECRSSECRNLESRIPQYRFGLNAEFSHAVLGFLNNLWGLGTE